MAFARTQGFEVHDWTGFPVASVSVALGSPVAVGDVCFAMTTYGSDSADNGDVRDNLGNVYVRDSGPRSVTGGQSLAWWRVVITVGGTPTVTYTPTASQAFVAILGDHFTGTNASSTRRDGQSQAETNPGTGTDAIDSTSVASQSGDLVWGCTGDPSSGSNAAVTGTGWTSASALNTTTSCGPSEWKTASGAGAATFTSSGGGAAIYGTGSIAITTGIAAALTGTVTASITEADIVAGGKTIILTLTGDTWRPS